MGEVVASLVGVGAAAGGEHAVASALDDGFELCGPVGAFVEGAVEGDFHGCGELDHFLGGLAVDGAVGVEEADDYGGDAELLAGEDVVANDVELGCVVAEVAFAGADEDVGADAELLGAVGDGAVGGGEASAVEALAEFDAVGSCGFGVDGRVDAGAAEFDFHWWHWYCC